MNIEPTVAVHVDDAEDVVRLLNILEDWLRHASHDTRDELAHFTGRTPSALNPAHRRPRPPGAATTPRPHHRPRQGPQAMSELITTRITDNAQRLGLSHLADTAAQLVARAEADNLGYLDLVDLLLEEELGLREGRRFRYALKLSGLPHHKNIGEFDFAFQTDLDPGKIRTWPRSPSSPPSPTLPCSAHRSARPAAKQPTEAKPTNGGRTPLRRRSMKTRTATM